MLLTVSDGRKRSITSIETVSVFHSGTYNCGFLGGQVYAGAKPYVEKVINHLTEGLMEALLNVFTENKTKVLKLLDVQGYCQLMLEVCVSFKLFTRVLNSLITNGFRALDHAHWINDAC